MGKRETVRALRECSAEGARRVLRSYRECLTRQELRTLNGQIRAGYADDAMRGLARLLAEWKDKKAEARDG